MKKDDINVPVVEDREKLLEKQEMPKYKRLFAWIGIVIFIIGVAGSVGSCFITRTLYYPHCCYNELVKCADGCYYPEYPYYPHCCYGEGERCEDGCNYAPRYVPNALHSTFQLIGIIGIGIGALIFLSFYISGSLPLMREKKREQERLRMEYERKAADETGDGGDEESADEESGDAE